MGAIVGALVGDVVGALVGDVVGALVGDSVGTTVGLYVEFKISIASPVIIFQFRSNKTTAVPITTKQHIELTPYLTQGFL